MDIYVDGCEKTIELSTILYEETSVRFITVNSKVGDEEAQVSKVAIGDKNVHIIVKFDRKYIQEGTGKEKVGDVPNAEAIIEVNGVEHNVKTNGFGEARLSFAEAKKEDGFLEASPDIDNKITAKLNKQKITIPDG